jgi:hypothetical protein
MAFIHVLQELFQFTFEDCWELIQNATGGPSRLRRLAPFVLRHLLPILFLFLHLLFLPRFIDAFSGFSKTRTADRCRRLGFILSLFGRDTPWFSLLNLHIFVAVNAKELIWFVARVFSAAFAVKNILALGANVRRFAAFPDFDKVEFALAVATLI